MAANQLYRDDFTYVGSPYPVPTDWTLPTGNPSMADKPTVITGGWAITSRVSPADWRLKSSFGGHTNYRYDAHCKWKNPGGATRALTLLARFKDYNNWVGITLSSVVAGNPTLQIQKCISGSVTNVGSAYTGSDISSSDLFAGVTISIVVEDVDGDTRVRGYVGSTGAGDRGTARVDETLTDNNTLQGNYGIGLRWGNTCKFDDIMVDFCEVFDLTDDAANAQATTPGDGWTVQLGDTVYDLDALQALSPPIDLISVSQAYMPTGCEARFRVNGQFQQGSGILRPGLSVIVKHDGDIRFRGEMASGQQIAAPQEYQDWVAKDIGWLATKVIIEETDGSGTRIYNVFDTKSEDYRSTRSGMTIGEIIQDLFDEYTDGDEGLRFFGAAPDTGDAYVASDLTALDGVPTDIAVSGNFVAAVLSVLSFYPTHALFVDPDTKQWRFRDVTSLTGEEIALTSEWATLTVSPDQEKAYTAVKMRGAKRKTGDDVTLTWADRMWTDDQEANWSRDKKHLGHTSLTAISGGTAVAPDGVNRPYVDVVAGQIEINDWRGSIATVAGDSFPRWVVEHSSTRIWMSSPAWGGGTPPSFPATITMSLIDPAAVPEYSAMGVGRVFLYRPVVGSPCPGGWNESNLKNYGRCGTATIEELGLDDTTYSYTTQFSVWMPTAAQQTSLGWCPVVKLADAPKPPIGLVNFLPQAGGSPPSSDCSSGAASNFSKNVTINLSSYEEDVPSFRVPAAGWYGKAFSEDNTLWEDADATPLSSDWGIRRTYTWDEPYFVDDSQEAGLTPIAEAVLEIASQKPYLFEVRMATPWSPALPDANQATTTEWAGLQKRITLSSTKRTTGFEAADNLPVFSVAWAIQENTTTVQAGTVLGWLGDIGGIVRALSARSAALKSARMLQQLEETRQTFLNKPVDTIPAQEPGSIDGCRVTVVDQNTRTIKTVTIDDEDKKSNVNAQALGNLVTQSIDSGIDQSFPGAQVSVPGFTDTQVVDGPVLQSPANHRIPFMGPPSTPNADRGKYGGLTGSENSTAYSPSQVLIKRGGFAFRGKANKNNSGGGFTGLEFSQLDSAGEPTTWSDYNSPLDLPNERFPLKAANHNSIDHQLVQRDDAIARELGIVKNAVDEMKSPGDITDDYPDGVPANLASLNRVNGLLNPYLRIIPSTFNDAGGLVFYVANSNGVNSGSYWRVAAPEMVLVEVENTPGAGSNGGDWSPVPYGGGVRYATSLTILHKQLTPTDLSDQGTAALRSVISQPENPLCLVGHEGRVLPPPSGADYAGVGGVVAFPPGAEGTPAFVISLKEDVSGAADLVDRTMNLRIQYATQASAWSSLSVIPAAAAIVTDGSNTGTGVYRQPGGAVPPGLRAIAIAGQYVSGGTATGNMVISDIAVEITIVDGGYWARIREGLSLSESFGHNNPWETTVIEMSESVAFEVNKGLSEDLEITEAYTVELNPYDIITEGLAMTEAVTVEVV